MFVASGETLSAYHAHDGEIVDGISLAEATDRPQVLLLLPSERELLVGTREGVILRYAFAPQ